MPMIMTTDQSEWFRRMRHEWMRVMRPMNGLFDHQALSARDAGSAGSIAELQAPA